LIWVEWEVVATKELMEFYGVILNMTRNVKSSIKDISLNSGLTLHSSKRMYFEGREFYNYIGVLMSLPLLGLKLQVGKCSPELAK
jgi:hypothetical protein